MYMSGRVESSSQYISTWSYTHKAQSTWCYLIGDVHTGSMLDQLPYSPHTPFLSCQNEGCFLILQSSTTKAAVTLPTLVLHVSYFALHHPMDLLALHHSIGIA